MNPNWLSPADVKKRLRAAGIGGVFSRFRLLDGEFTTLPFDDYRELVDRSLARLAMDDLTPSEDYHANDADCDNWSLWIQSEVTKIWAKKKTGRALCFGRAIVPGHSTNIALTLDGPVIFDYGIYKPDFDVTKILANEVEFE